MSETNAPSTTETDSQTPRQTDQIVPTANSVVCTKMPVTVLFLPYKFQGSFPINNYYKWSILYLNKHLHVSDFKESMLF